MVNFIGYILQSLSDGTNYIGQTGNIDERIVKHNRGEVLSTKKQRPWVIIYSVSFGTRSDAMRWEREVKSHKSRSYIEKLIHSERGAAR
jgi:putative endonuclease